MFRMIGRAFFGSFFGVLGVLAALIVVAVVIGILSFGDKGGNVRGRYEIIPNADGTREELARTSPLILFLEVKGIIGPEQLDSEKIREQLGRSQNGALEGRIRGVFLSVNSPGGSVIDSNTIYHLILQYKQRYDVPIYAYVDGLGASGSYLISCAADKIYASDVSLIGSVGVLANFLNFSGTIDKLGMKALVLTKGTGKAAMNPLEPWKEGDDASIKEIISYYYDQFVDIVTTQRPNIEKQKLIDEYGAHVFPAPQSLGYGYIDDVINTRSEALAELVEACELTDKEYQVIQLEKDLWLQNLFQSVFPMRLLAEKIPQEGLLYLYR